MTEKQLMHTEKKEILTAFKKIQKQDPITRIDQRRDKFIAMGNIEE